MFVETDSQVAVIFDTETHIEQTECQVGVEIEHAAVELLEEQLFVTCLRMEWGNGLACRRVNIEHIADSQHVVAYAKRHPSQRSEIDITLANRLEGRVDGVAHRSVLKEIQGVHLLSACADGCQCQEDNGPKLTIHMHGLVLLIYCSYLCFHSGSIQHPHDLSSRSAF